MLPKPADDPVLSSVPLPATSDIEYLPPPAFSITEQAAPIHTSSRISKPPSYLRDYHCNLLSSNSLDTSRAMYPLSDDYLSSDSLFNKHKHFILHVSSDYEPKFYHEAVHFPRWRAAMNKEISVMEDNQTWSAVPLPPGEHTVGCRWVYKRKYASNGSVDRHKARLVAKGYTQQAGLTSLKLSHLLPSSPHLRFYLL